ncbi:leucine-rich repeat-containing protein egg-6-like isoform X1 [Nylanderia fulva]|uniref:leucine-rich repeat-containing protein egg-6-like isoform X1 n=1 Tax=Nylanderia fulva TaxID=613905 RepID=UPI0010FB2035|nr:leucine-rich repeat-containing protein egg-6-like isoform X1 [Nylanderia fulva]XP_029163244.1 leucine-rich repeat-containing protein egg-6-like isoform X1 [Nylanderia fulva]
MSIFLINEFFLLGLAMVTVLDVLVLGTPKTTKIVDKNPPPTMCNYSRANSILKARCSNRNLRKIPLDLKANIQVLDMSGSHLMVLTNKSLHSYKKLAYIDLGNNFIHEIDEVAFANQPYLKVLNLTKNLLLTLPKSIFQLPYLRTLYLGDNDLIDSAFKVKVTSPLRLLQLFKNKLTAIPNIGVQPTLLNLNVSDNEITSISTEDLAPFCSLKKLDLTRNRIRFNASSCDCQTFIAWVKLRQIKMKPNNLYDCTVSLAALNEACANVRFSNRTYELFDQCSAMIPQKIETEEVGAVWISVALCIIVLLFVVFMALFYVYKRYRREQMGELIANDFVELYRQ